MAGNEGPASLAPVDGALLRAPGELPAATSDARRSSHPVHSGVWHAVETAQTVLTSLLLAFIFRAFLIEAFMIPTGSMATSLLGAHGRIYCPACGFEFVFGADGAGSRPGGAFVAPPSALCPNCLTRTDLDPQRVLERAGDRILVHKWPFVVGGWFGPRRWDVIVFRDPTNPAQNYIKRLAALPGESIEIIDGDVYINGAIARKTAAAQSALWQHVFDQDYPPSDPEARRQAWAWRPAPSEPVGSGWTGFDERVLRFAPPDAAPHTIELACGDLAWEGTDVSGYNHGSSGALVGDFRVRAELTPLAGEGWWRFEIWRDGTLFAAEFQRGGRVRLTMRPAGAEARTLAGTDLGAFWTGRPVAIEFGHVDYRVYVRVGDREVLATRDDQYAPQLERLRLFHREQPVRLSLTASQTALALRRLRVERDVHYTYSRGATQRAYAGRPFTLDPDEYFVLGDNSARSFDSREWYECATPMDAERDAGRYQLGAVRADQIVGRAFLVYLPALMPLDPAGRWRFPDLGRIRFVR